MFNIADYAEATKAMKSADTTAENKATPWARLTLTGLVGGELTIATMTAALCAAYKPKTAQGKPATTIGALPASPRGRANTMKYIMDNLGVAGVRPVVDLFVADNKDAPKSIAALHTAVKAAIKSAGETLAGEEPSDADDEADNVGADGNVIPVSKADAFAAIAANIRALSVEEVAEYQAQIADILDACREAAERLVAPVSAVA